MSFPKRSLWSLGLVLATALSAQAHSLRVIVTRPVQEPGRKGTVYLCWGHLLPVDELVAAEDLGLFQLHTPSGSTRPLESSGRSLQANEVTFDEPGLYQVAATRKTSVYTSYADATGKIAFARLPKSEVKVPEGGKINSSAKGQQFAKAVVISGDSANRAMAPLGHALEIVVEGSPGPKGYSPDEPMRVRLLFHGKPLAGVKVSAANTRLNPDGGPEVSAETDAEGRVALDLAEPGTWVLEASHKVDASPEDRRSFDFDSYLATLSIPVAGEK
jgi:uncharacterized GH25 family protein